MTEIKKQYLNESNTFYTDGAYSLLTSIKYMISNTYCTLEKFGMNFLGQEDEEMRVYLDIVQTQLNQIEKLVQLCSYFLETSKTEKM